MLYFLLCWISVFVKKEFEVLLAGICLALACTFRNPNFYWLLELFSSLLGNLQICQQKDNPEISQYHNFWSSRWALLFKIHIRPSLSKNQVESFFYFWKCLSPKWWLNCKLLGSSDLVCSYDLKYSKSTCSEIAFLLGSLCKEFTKPTLASLPLLVIFLTFILFLRPSTGIALACKLTSPF